jgi:hypothetical protein
MKIKSITQTTILAVFISTIMITTPIAYAETVPLAIEVGDKYRFRIIEERYDHFINGINYGVDKTFDGNIEVEITKIELKDDDTVVTMIRDQNGTKEQVESVVDDWEFVFGVFGFLLIIGFLFGIPKPAESQFIPPDETSTTIDELLNELFEIYPFFATTNSSYYEELVDYFNGLENELDINLTDDETVTQNKVRSEGKKTEDDKYSFNLELDLAYEGETSGKDYEMGYKYHFFALIDYTNSLVESLKLNFQVKRVLEAQNSLIDIAIEFGKASSGFGIDIDFSQLSYSSFFVFLSAIIVVSLITRRVTK